MGDGVCWDDDQGRCSMRVRMLVDIQGYTIRADGSLFEFPRRGGEVEVDDQAAHDLIHQGYAIPVTTGNLREETTRRPDLDEEQRTPFDVDIRPTPPPPPAVLTEAPATEHLEAVRDTPTAVTVTPAVTAKRGPGRPRKNPI